MHVDIAVGKFEPQEPIKVGNVYPSRGGRNLKYGYMMILFAITEPCDRYEGQQALLLVVDKEGRPRGVTHYGLSYLEDKTPIAFVDGLEDMRWEMRSL